ncbi:MAG: helix-turn-helix domain-containing protein [Clostridia bacterium]|nr:helix-turn-helix domain-containing protein [Clostridia bacterium]
MHDNDKVNYGKLIKKLRTKNCMTQTELGELIGLGKTAISNYETGYVVPSLSVMEKLSEALGLTLLEFLMYDKEAKEKLEGFSMPRYRQNVSELVIPYIKEENVNRDTIDSAEYADSTLIFPAFMLESSEGYFCVKMNDNSMTADGISKNDYLIIKIAQAVNERQIAIVLDSQNSTYLIRRYIREGHIASLIPSSNSGEYPVLRIDERDSKFVIKGYVEKVISNTHF